MKIILINGSPRKNGVTAQILQCMQNKLTFNGAETEFVHLSELNMQHCNGCCSCYRTGHCHIHDDAEKLSEKIVLADGIVIGSPTYASNVSGLLKQFIDRGHFVIEQLLHGKYAVCIATGENYGSRSTSKILDRLLLYSGAQISGSMVSNVPHNASIQKYPAIKHNAGSIADKLYSDINRQKDHIVQKIVHKFIFSVGIKPFVLGKGESYQGVINRWKENGVNSFQICPVSIRKERQDMKF